MVWVVPLSDYDLSTLALTPVKRFLLFGVCLGLAGFDSP